MLRLLSFGTSEELSQWAGNRGLPLTSVPVRRLDLDEDCVQLMTLLFDKSRLGNRDLQELFHDRIVHRKSLTVEELKECVHQLLPDVTRPGSTVDKKAMLQNFSMSPEQLADIPVREVQHICYSAIKSLDRFESVTPDIVYRLAREVQDGTLVLDAPREVQDAHLASLLEGTGVAIASLTDEQRVEMLNGSRLNNEYPLALDDDVFSSFTLSVIREISVIHELDREDQGPVLGHLLRCHTVDSRTALEMQQLLNTMLTKAHRLWPAAKEPIVDLLRSLGVEVDSAARRDEVFTQLRSATEEPTRLHGAPMTFLRKMFMVLTHDVIAKNSGAEKQLPIETETNILNACIKNELGSFSGAERQVWILSLLRAAPNFTDLPVDSVKELITTILSFNLEDNPRNIDAMRALFWSILADAPESDAAWGPLLLFFRTAILATTTDRDALSVLLFTLVADRESFEGLEIPVIRKVMQEVLASVYTDAVVETILTRVLTIFKGPSAVLRFLDGMSADTDVPSLPLTPEVRERVCDMYFEKQKRAAGF
jgi:hypothetical protein